MKYRLLEVLAYPSVAERQSEFLKGIDFSREYIHGKKILDAGRG